MNRPERESPFGGDAKEDAELALAVLLEPIAQGARVLWIGEPGAGAERLVPVASSVEAIGAPRRTRSGRRSGTVRTRPWPSQGEAFDLVIVPDFTDKMLSDQARALELARLVEVGGALVVATDATSTETYGRLHASLAQRFAKVRMLGQTRFAGFAHVDFARANGGELAFDGSAIETAEAPIRWIAVAGSMDRTFEPYLVVQTPSTNVAVANAVPVAAEPPPVERVERAAEGKGALEREVEAARARLEHAEKRLEQAQREIARNGQKLDELRHQLEQSQASLHKREAELRASNDALGNARHALEERAARPVASPAEIRELEAGYAEIEERLRTQGAELTSLRVELERRAVLVRDLVEELKEARASRPSAPLMPPTDALPETDRLRAQLAGLQRRLADAEGERAASVFRADELAAQVARLKSAPTVAPAPSTPPARTSVAPTSSLEVEARVRVATEMFAQEREALLLARSEAEARANAAADDRAAIERARAEAEGRVRGLRARAAELDELRSLAEGRLALASDDALRANERALLLEREVADSREQLAMARMRPPETDDGARREGELLGSLHRSREALAAAQDERDSLVRDLARARAGLLVAEQEADAARDSATRQVAEQRSELELLRASESVNRGALVELRGAHEAALTSLDALEGERSGLRFRLADAEEALRGAQARVHAEAEKMRAAQGQGDAFRAEIDAHRAELEVLRKERASLVARAEEARVLGSKLKEGAGERLADGEVLDLAQQVAILDAERAEARKIGMLLGDVERDLEAIRKERDAEAAAARDARQALAELAEGERVKVSGWVQRVAARDALVSRLQSAIASAEASRASHQGELRALEERLMRAQEQGSALEVALQVQRSEDQRERAMLSDAAISARAAADALAGSRESGLRVLGETREALSHLIEGIKAPAPGTPEAVLRDEIGALRRELDDRGLMLRSLTAQLEERDERLRSFQQGGLEQGARQAIQSLEGRLRDAEEKEIRLVRELELAAERRAAAMEREAELRRLEQLLGDRDGELMANEGHLEQSQRAQAALRDQLARLSSELESVLARSGSESPTALVERLGEILRALRRS